MTGRIAVIAIVAAALLMGGVVWYMQVWGYYTRLPATAEVRITRAGGEEIAMAVKDFQGIDADSSPIRYRACFTAPDLPPDAAPYPGAVPLVAPGWFSCFDARAIDTALAAGRARAYLGQANVHWGVDRVIAVFDDGRAVAWHQINACGREVFEGRPAPAGCPPQRGETP